MPFDIVGFSEAAPGTGTVGVACALGDSLYTVSGDDMQIRAMRKAIIALLYAAESTPGYARLKTPGLKNYWEFIKGYDVEGGTAYVRMEDLRRRPIPIVEGDKLNVYSNNATDEDTLIGIAISDGKFPINGDIDFNPETDVIMRGTVDQTQTANTWTFGTVTWSQNLTNGKYAAMGLRAAVYKAANPGMALVRLVGLDEQWRPGVVANIAAGDKVSVLQNIDPTLEIWGEMKGCTFPSTALPNIECLSPYANTDIVLQMIVRKIG